MTQATCPITQPQQVMTQATCPIKTKEQDLNNLLWKIRNAYWDLFNEVSGTLDFPTYSLYKGIIEDIDEELDKNENPHP